MATHLQTEPSLQRLESITQHISNFNSVNFSTQLSINDSCDSCPTTSAHLMFICRTNTNLNGNLLFPLGERYKYTTKHFEKISWHNLLNYLKSQRIVKNIEIFKKLKRQQKYDTNTQRFPLDLEKIKKERFPCKNAIEKVYTPPFHSKRKDITLKKLKFPTKLITGKRTFPCNGKEIKEKNKNVLNVRDYKRRQLSSKFKQQSTLKRTLIKLPIDDTNLKRFPCPKNMKCKGYKEFPIQDNLNSVDRIHEKRLKFPQKLTQIEEHFPLECKYQSNTNLNIRNFKQQFKIRKVSETSPKVLIYDEQCFTNLITTFPYESYLKSQLAAHSCLTEFPIHNEQLNHKRIELHSLNNNWVIENKNPKTSSFSPSLAIAQSVEKMENIHNEHVFQVQDAQVYVEKNPQSLTSTKNTQPRPKAPTAKIINCSDHDVVNKLTNINSINNNRLNEVAYYADKIERIQDAVIALFEKIQNSFTTNHNNNEHESINAAKHDLCNRNIRFALTPPMSVTSVQNTERNDYEEVLHKKYDLDDLCDRQDGQIVECSDVHDTLTETVDYGITKEQTKSTGSLLVKSEESISPNSLIPYPLNTRTSEYTSLEDCVNATELLPKYDVLAVNEDVNNILELDSIKRIGISMRETDGTVIKTCECNLTSAKVNEITVTDLPKNEGNTKNEKSQIQSSEVLKQKNDILSKDLQNNEMKFEMNRAKSALPSSISERSLGKHDEVITKNDNGHYGRHTGTNSTRLATDITASNNRLPYSLGSTRSYNDSSYNPRSSLTNESSTLATTVSKRSTLPLDGVTNRSVISTPKLNETISSRAALTSIKSRNDYDNDTLSQRRPSLRILGNPQATSMLSVDLPRYTPLTTITDQTTSLNRAVSIDSSLGDILPERTRLRRQRRLRSQNTQDEPEDALERLNRLKARISASLSEVKGVLKQYSTEAENDNETQTAASANSVTETKLEEEKEAPIVFRFVKKVRRRSLFTQDDENVETNSELLENKTEKHLDKQQEIKDEKANCNKEIRSTLPTRNSEIIEESNKKPLEIQDEEKYEAHPPPLDTNEVKINTNLYTLKEEVREALEDVSQTEIKSEKTIMDNNENNETSRDGIQTLKEETKGAIPKPSFHRVHETTNMENDFPAHETTKKVKKKIVIKSRDPNRRASLAAVEGSKIEPAVNVAIPAKIRRRPSDTEAVIKKKPISAKTNTSGVVEEVTPKPKIVKVKKPATKENKNSQLATTQMKLDDKDTLATIESNKIDDHAKLIDKDNKSIPTDKNQDVLMPKRPEPNVQQQFNTELTRQTNLLQPAQLVIDEAASLNKKTIENSVLPPRQEQQQQNREQDHQTTIKSTATNFLSNDLQAKGAMLENITNVLSSSTTIEANRQIERENCVQQEDLHDLLQEETTFIKPFTTNKQNELKLVNQAGNLQSTEKPKENLENFLATTKKQQENSATQQQQVSTTTDVIHVKSDNDKNTNNKHEDIKVKASVKEPCIDKSTTSTHDGAEQQQQQEQHHHQLLVADEQSITNVNDTKAISSPHISISSTSDITHKTATASILSSDLAVEEKAEVPANQHNTMPELQLAPAPVQTADIISHADHHKKNIIINKIVRQASIDKIKKVELETTTQTKLEAKQIAVEATTNETNLPQEPEQVSAEANEEILDDEFSESNEISESSTSIGSEEVSATQLPKKERKVKKKVIIKRQKRRLSISDNFFRSGSEVDTQNADIETLEKPIAYVSDDESEPSSDKLDEEAKDDQEGQEEKKPLKSCILHKEYNIGDEVLYAERFKKTQIKWRRGRIKERITSISYLLDIDGKDVSSHINYLKKFTGRKVSFGGKEYLEIDYEQLAEEEEKAEKLQRRTYSIWNMV